MCCDLCGRTMHKHGRYFRWVVTKRQYIQIPIYRWFCPNCKITVSLLPDFLVPWARFTTWIREAVIVRKRKGFAWSHIMQSVTSLPMSVSISTVKRWWKRYLSIIQPLSLWLAQALVMAGCNEDLLRMYPRPVRSTQKDAVIWFEQLQTLYTSKDSHLRGYWSFLNTKLPLQICL